MARELDEAYHLAREAFLPLDEVIGVGFGPKVRRGRVVARQAIIVLVERKLPARKVPDGHMVPAEFAGWPTDVRTPRLMLEGAPDHGRLEGQPRDFCLTDYQWIDWPKVHKRHSASGGDRS